MPKLKPQQAIRKLVISHGLKINNDIRVYYAWTSFRPHVDPDTGMPKQNFFVVDFDPKVAEWYITYVTTKLKTCRATIDDITGSISIST